MDNLWLLTISEYIKNGKPNINSSPLHEGFFLEVEHVVCVFQEKKELILLSENPCLFFGAFFVPSYMFLFEGWEHEPAFSKHFQTYQLQRHLYKKLRATSLFLLSALFEYGRRNTSPPNPSLPSRLTVACVSVYLLIPLCAPTTGPPYVLLAPFPFAPSVVATFFFSVT